jgi:molybdopterin-guanine dinucleotide biosynthesis protein A
VVAARGGQELPALPDDVVVVHDAVEDAGPLAGIAVAFDALTGRCEAAFVTSCDHPLLKRRFIQRLIELLEDRPAVVPEHDDHLAPLLAVYRLETRSILAEMLAQGERRAHDFARRCRGRLVPARQFQDVDPDLDSLRNVNNPHDYGLMLQALDGD